MRILLLCVLLDIFPIFIQKPLPSTDLQEPGIYEVNELTQHQVHSETVHKEKQEHEITHSLTVQEEEEADSPQFVKEKRSFYLGDYVNRKPLAPDSPKSFEHGIQQNRPKKWHRNPRQKHSKHLDSYFDDRPLVKIEVHNTPLSSTNLELDDGDQSEEVGEPSVGDVSRCLHSYLSKQGRYGNKGSRQPTGSYWPPDYMSSKPIDDSNVSSPWRIVKNDIGLLAQWNRRSRTGRYKRSANRGSRSGDFQGDFRIGDRVLNGLFSFLT